MASKAAYYTVTDSFISRQNGEEVEFQKGEVVDGDDPAVRKWPSHFAPLIVRSRRAVEQATAAPGERR